MSLKSLDPIFDNFWVPWIQEIVLPVANYLYLNQVELTISATSALYLGLPDIL